MSNTPELVSEVCAVKVTKVRRARDVKNNERGIAIEIEDDAGTKAIMSISLRDASFLATLIPALVYQSEREAFAEECAAAQAAT